MVDSNGYSYWSHSGTPVEENKPKKKMFDMEMLKKYAEDKEEEKEGNLSEK